jgi:tyrosine-specific transport protein
MDKRFWSTVFTLTGGIIGAGILALPYTFSKSGFLIGLFWLFILSFVVIFTGLCFGEVILRTRSEHHLIGYADKYLGKWGKRIVSIAFLFGIYSALIAYLIGEGRSLSIFFTGNLSYSIYFAIGFWFIMAILLRDGLRGLRKIETWGVLGVIFIILIIFLIHLPEVRIENLIYNNYDNLFFPFGVVLFALLGFSSIPELRKEINGEEKKLKKVILLGYVIPIIVYIIFTFTFVGTLGKNVPEIATLGFGKLVVLLGIFTMTTSFFVLSFALKDSLKLDLRLNNHFIFFFVSVFPILLYFIIQSFGFFDFITILGLAGVICGGLDGILILLMNKKAKKQGSRKPEYSIPINWFIIILFILIFIAGVLFEFII